MRGFHGRRRERNAPSNFQQLDLSCRAASLMPMNDSATQAGHELIDMGLASVTAAQLAQYRRIITTPTGRELQFAENRVADAVCSDADPDQIRQLQRRADDLYERARRADEEALCRARVSSSRNPPVRVRPQVRSRRRRSVAARTRSTPSCDSEPPPQPRRSSPAEREAPGCLVTSEIDR